MDKSAQIKIIKAKIALLDAEKEQLLKKLCNIEKETAPSADSLRAILKSPYNQPISLDKKIRIYSGRTNKIVSKFISWP